MKVNTLTALSLVLLVNYAAALNILGIFPFEGKSHFFQFKIYLQELAKRGHNVTVMSYFPDKDPLPNYHDIYIKETEILADNVPVQKSYLTLLATSVFLSIFGINNCKALVESPRVQDFVNSKPKFDVIIVEQFNTDCPLGIAYKLGAPVVGITSHVLMPFHYDRFGIPSNPAFVPFHFLEGGTKPSLYQRVERVVFDAYFKLFYKFVQWSDRNTLIAQFGDVPPLEDLAQEIKILLLYQNFILTGTRLLPSNVIEVGGYHVAKAKPLTAHPKTVAFMSHSGLSGATEAIHYGVPVVATPIFGDQPSNAFAIEESGLGVHLAFNDIDKETLLTAFRKVTDLKFRARVKEVSRAWHDRPMSAMDSAVYWTEFAARNANFTLRAAAADTPLLQHWGLDVAAVFVALLLLTVYAIKLLRKLRKAQKKSEAGSNIGIKKRE